MLGFLRAPGRRGALGDLGLHRRAGAGRGRAARGRRATTHWASHDFLAALGATPVQARVVRDGNLVTGGGVTAGIDFALTIVAEIAGPEAAQAIQLQIEYAPAPPFDAGTRPPPRPRCWPRRRPAAPACGRSARRWSPASPPGWRRPDLARERNPWPGRRPRPAPTARGPNRLLLLGLGYPASAWPRSARCCR